jgi:hypothetical protein
MQPQDSGTWPHRAATRPSSSGCRMIPPSRSRKIACARQVTPQNPAQVSRTLCGHGGITATASRGDLFGCHRAASAREVYASGGQWPLTESCTALAVTLSHRAGAGQGLRWRQRDSRRPRATGRSGIASRSIPTRDELEEAMDTISVVHVRGDKVQRVALIRRH